MDLRQQWQSKVMANNITTKGGNLNDLLGILLDYNTFSNVALVASVQLRDPEILQVSVMLLSR